MRPYDERLEHFLTQAAGVFAEQGYHAATMRDLARATGMSLSGMYYYVRSKEDLLLRIQDRCARRLLAGAEEALAPLAHADACERLQAFIRHHLQFLVPHRAEMKLLDHDGRYREMLEGLVTAAAGEDAGSPQTTAALLFAMMNALDPLPAMDVERFAGLLVQLALGGVAPAPSPVHG